MRRGLISVYSSQVLFQPPGPSTIIGNYLLTFMKQVLIPNPRYEIFVVELKRTRPWFSEWSGIAFRAASLEFARAVKLLDGKGSLKFGGRWSAAKTFPAVNLSTTQDSALRESGANFDYYHLRSINVAPKVVVGVQLRLRKMIDLTDSQGISQQPWLCLKELLAEDWRKVNDAGR
jgi:RES domain-containing protein